MSNEEYLIYLSKAYDSAKQFSIINNKLVLGNDSITLKNISLKNINERIFNISNPNIIFNIICMYDLLYYPTLTTKEVNFVTTFTQTFITLSSAYLENYERNNTYINPDIIWALSLPIYDSYNPMFQNNEASKIITDMCKVLEKGSVLEEDSSSNTRGPSLKLTNKNVIPISTDEIADYTKAGFVTILIIGATVAVTILYIVMVMTK